MGQALDDGRLAHARLADQHRVVLGTPREHLNDPAHLLIAPDHRVQLPLTRHRRQVPPVLLQRLVGRLGGWSRHALVPPHLNERLVDGVARQAVVAQNPRDGSAHLRVGHGQQEVLSGEVFILQVAHLLLRAFQDAPQPGGDAELRGGAADGRELRDGPVERLRDLACISAQPHKDTRHDAIGLVHQGEQQMLRLQLSIMMALGELLRGGHGLARLFGEEIGVQVWTILSRACRALRARFRTSRTRRGVTDCSIV